MVVATDSSWWFTEIGDEAGPKVAMAEVQQKKPLTELEKLQRALDEAIQVEDYEKAAVVRDQMKKLSASDK